MDIIFNSFLGKSIVTLITAMLPVVELRGAIPFGVYQGLDIWYSFALSFIGNLIPVPFIIVFIKRVFAWMQTKSKILDKWVNKKIRKTLAHRKAIMRSELIALCIFVAIPLPGTGAWTGALLAALLDLRLKNAFPVIALGVLIAGIIVVTLTYGVTTIFG